MYTRIFGSPVGRHRFFLVSKCQILTSGCWHVVYFDLKTACWDCPWHIDFQIWKYNFGDLQFWKFIFFDSLASGCPEFITNHRIYTK